MRVAVLHDHLGFIGGGERVALAITAALDADLFVTDLDPTLPGRVGHPDVRVREIARVPRRPPARQSRQARAFSSARLAGYDAYVLSGNWAVFASKGHRPNVWYCHTPVRVFYDLRESFLSGLSGWRRRAARSWITRVRPRYEDAVAGVERIVANSRNVAGRIERYLGRPAEVVYPPVNVSRFRFVRVGDFWLSVNRLSHEKRIDLQVEAFRRLPRERLLIAGGPGVGVDIEDFVSNLDPPANVQVLGEVEESKLIDLYATCRGLLATSLDEDFGLAPVEAMAAGKAVVAVDEGGYRESVVPGVTGWLVPPTPEDVMEALSRATPDVLEAMRDACEARASAFDEREFASHIRELVASIAGGS